jgi:hypothetical protein
LRSRWVSDPALLSLSASLAKWDRNKQLLNSSLLTGLAFMSKYSHAGLQVLLVAAQLLNALSTLVPVKYQPLVMAVLAATQAGIALANHPAKPVA